MGVLIRLIHVLLSQSDQKDRDTDNWDDLCDNCPSVCATTRHHADNVGDLCDNARPFQIDQEFDSDQVVCATTTVLESKYGSDDGDKDVGDLCRAENKNTTCFGLWAKCRAPGTHLAFSGIRLSIFSSESTDDGV